MQDNLTERYKAHDLEMGGATPPLAINMKKEEKLERDKFMLNFFWIYGTGLIDKSLFDSAVEQLKYSLLENE